MVTVNERIEEIILEKGITKRALAKKLGIPESTMFSWFTENHPKQMKDKTIQQFADYFGVSVEFLKTGKHPSHNNFEEINPSRNSAEKRLEIPGTKIIKYNGEPLEPYIYNGDSLLIDLSEPTIEGNTVYLIFVNEKDYVVRKISKSHFVDSVSLYKLDGTLECTISNLEYKRNSIHTFKVIGLWRKFN